LAEKSKQQVQIQPQIQVPEDLRSQFQELSIRSNGYDVARRDYNVEVNKAITTLLQKVNAQEDQIKSLQAELVKYKVENPKVEEVVTKKK
jgi:hypothetical protein